MQTLLSSFLFVLLRNNIISVLTYRISKMFILLEVLMVYHMAFSPMKRGRGRLTRILDEIVKKELMVSNILENLVFN